MLTPLSAAGRVLVVLVVGLYLALSLWGAWVKSETYDEPMYLLSGYSYVTTGDFSLNREHPPLSKLLIGASLLALDLELPADYQREPGIVYSFFAHQPRADPHMMLFLARLGGILMGLVLGLYTLRWARVAFGNGAGLAALTLCLLNPNILAHARVAANDLAPAVFMFAASYHVWRWLETERRSSLLFGALTLGLALGAKLTALMLLPVLGLVILACALRRRRPVLLAHATLALAASLAVPYLLYAGEARSLEQVAQHVRFDARDGSSFQSPLLRDGLRAVFDADTPIPLLSYLKAVDHQLDHASSGHFTYFKGKVDKEGPWSFFLVSTAIKNPVGLLLLLALALLVWRRTWRGALHESCLLGAASLQLVILSAADVQLGFRYLLPAVPCLAVMAARVFDPRMRERPFRGAAVALLLVVAVAAEWLLVEPGQRTLLDALPALVVLTAGAVLLSRPLPDARRWTLACALLLFFGVGEALARQPHNLMFFNAWAGGPERGTFYSVVGDDWGQDTRALGLWMAEHHVESLTYDHYGTGDPRVWGVRSTPSYARPGSTPEPGLFAIHVSQRRRGGATYAWLDGLEPIADLGGGIQVFDVTAEHIAAWSAARALASEG